MPQIVVIIPYDDARTKNLNYQRFPSVALANDKLTVAIIIIENRFSHPQGGAAISSETWPHRQIRSIRKFQLKTLSLNNKC